MCRRLDKTMKTHLMFRVLGSDLIPAQITKSLGIAPTKAYEKNEEYTVPRIGCTRVRSSGLWSFCTENFVSSTSVDEHAKYLLEQLEPRQAVIANLLRDPLLRIGIPIWWEIDCEHGSFSIPSEIMRRLSFLCHELDFHFIGTFEGDS